MMRRNARKMVEPDHTSRELMIVLMHLLEQLFGAEMTSKNDSKSGAGPAPLIGYSDPDLSGTIDSTGNLRCD
jgi:hypothetical protein